MSGLDNMILADSLLKDLPNMKMPSVESVELILAVLVCLTVVIITFHFSNYLDHHTFSWVVSLGFALVSIYKVREIYLRGGGYGMMKWWNIAFLVLMLIAAILLTMSDIRWARAGAAIMLIGSLVDIGFIWYSNRHVKSTGFDVLYWGAILGNVAVAAYLAYTFTFQ
jgi:hypothetical protein